METSAKGFFATLFDLEFKNFITVKFVKFIYIALIVFIVLTAFVYFVFILLTGFQTDAGGIIALLAVIGVPLVTLIYIVLLRVLLESVVVFFRIGENTSAMAAAAGPGTGGLPASDPTPPPFQG